MNLNAIGLGSLLPERLPERVSTDSRPPPSDPPNTSALGVPLRTDEGVPSGTARSVRPQSDADTELWGLLSTEERGFYLRHSLRGEATYRPESGLATTNAPGARLGARIDMRV